MPLSLASGDSSQSNTRIVKTCNGIKIEENKVKLSKYQQIFRDFPYFIRSFAKLIRLDLSLILNKQNMDSLIFILQLIEQDLHEQGDEI